MKIPLHEVRLQVEFKRTIKVLSHLLQAEDRLRSAGFGQLLVPKEDMASETSILLQPLRYTQTDSHGKVLRVAHIGLETVEYIENSAIYKTFEAFFANFNKLLFPILKDIEPLEMWVTYMDRFDEELVDEILWDFLREAMKTVFGDISKSMEPKETYPITGFRLPLGAEEFLEFIIRPSSAPGNSYDLRLTHVTYPEKPEDIKALAYKGRKLIKQVFYNLISKELVAAIEKHGKRGRKSK